MDWREMWYGESLRAKVIRQALVPASHLYALGWTTYAAWYAFGFKKPIRAGLPVICVGSITVGGAGKTPVATSVTTLLQKSGYQPAVSCSGYGGKVGFEILAPGAPADPEKHGEEAVLLRQELPSVYLLVGRSRVRAAKEAERLPGVDTLVLDDGFQHLPLSRTVDLVVLDPDSTTFVFTQLRWWPSLRPNVVSKTSGRVRCLPAGPLREPLRGLRRAHAIVVPEFDHVRASNRHPPTDATRDVPGSVSSNKEFDPETFTPRLFRVVRRPDRLVRLGEGTSMPLSYVQGKEVVALSAVGRPDKFEQSLEHLGALVRPLRFPDHHRYEPGDLEPLRGRVVVTTRKDAVKLERFSNSFEAWVLEESVRFEDEQGFLAFLSERLRSVQ